MLFSIIIPVYNVEKYLHQCIDSVLAQDFDDFELILVDDGSPDRCPQICDKYAAKDNRVVVIHKPNGGSSDARNAGILRAKGTYLCFIDSDDYWDASTALAQIAEKAQREKSDIISWGVRCLCNGEVSAGKPRDFSDYKDLTASDTLYKLVEEGKLHISACLMAVRRSFILSNELFFQKGIKSEDTEWSLRMFVLEPSWDFLDQSFYVYRIGREDSNTSTVDYRHLNTYCQIIEDSIERTKRCSARTRQALLSYIMYHVLICNALISRTRLEKKQRADLHKKLKPICKEYLLKNRLNKKVKLGGMVYRFLGYAGMTKILGFYLIHRS